MSAPELYAEYKRLEEEARSLLFGRKVRCQNWTVNFLMLAMETQDLGKLDQAKKETLHYLLSLACRKRREAAKLYQNASALARAGHEYYLCRLYAFCNSISLVEEFSDDLTQSQPSRTVMPENPTGDQKLSEIDCALIFSSLDGLVSRLELIITLHEEALTGRICISTLTIRQSPSYRSSCLYLPYLIPIIVSDIEYKEIFAALDAVWLLAKESIALSRRPEILEVQFQRLTENLQLPRTVYPELLKLVQAKSDSIVDMYGVDDSTKRDCQVLDTLLFENCDFDQAFHFLRGRLLADLLTSKNSGNREDKSFSAFSGSLAAHILLQLAQVWQCEPLERLREATLSEMHFLEVQVQGVQISRVQDTIPIEISRRKEVVNQARDVSSLAAVYTWANRTLSGIGEYEISLPLVPAVAHLYVWARMQNTFVRDEMLERLCKRFAKSLFWDGRPQTPKQWTSSFNEWVLVGYQPRTRRNKFWDNLGSAKIEKTHFATLYDAWYFPPDGRDEKRRLFHSKSSEERLAELNQEAEAILTLDPCLIAQSTESAFAILEIQIQSDVGSSSAAMRKRYMASFIDWKKDDTKFVTAFLGQLLKQWNGLREAHFRKGSNFLSPGAKQENVRDPVISHWS